MRFLSSSLISLKQYLKSSASNNFPKCNRDTQAKPIKNPIKKTHTQIYNIQTSNNQQADRWRGKRIKRRFTYKKKVDSGR